MFDLNTLWFVLVTILFIGYFILEGFDYGVGILMPLLGKDDQERRIIINTIGPVWDGNEVWLLTAGGAIFAAFPLWYATMFSGFYIALVLMLLALILRGVAIEFRSKNRYPTWRKTWDWAIFLGSLIPALLWGVALGNLLRGVPIDENMNYVGNFFTLLNPYALLGGVTMLSVFILHGAIFLALKTKDELVTRAMAATKKVGPVATVLVFAFVVATYFATDFVARLGINPGIVPIAAGGCLLAAGWFIHHNRPGWAFIMNSLTIGLSTLTIFMTLYPRVMISSLNPAWSLTIYNASSSPYTLTVMSVVALIFVPIVLVYQGWTYWIFRQRLGRDSELEY
jgi:cytochrome bd ubiquinol oxidase subunit II